MTRTKGFSSRNRAWDVAVCGGLCLAVGAGPVLTYSFGVFVTSISHSFGVSVAQVAAVPGIALILAAVMNPLAGLLADRVGARRVMVLGTLIFAAAVASFASTNSLQSLTVAYFVAQVAATGVGASLWYALLAKSFGESRGLAYGTTAMLTGIGVAANPVIASQLTYHYGWRVAMMCFGALILVIALPTTLWAHYARLPGAAHTPQPDLRRDLHEPAATLPDIWHRVRTKRLAKIVSLIFLANFAVGAMVVHLPAYLSAQRFDAPLIGAVMGAFGVSSIVSRLVFGALIDRIYAPWVCALAFSLPIVALLMLLGSLTVPAAFVVAVLLGMALGSEGSDAPYLVAAAFDHRSQATLMGVAVAALSVGMGVGPLILSLSLAHFGQYQPGLLALIVTSAGAVGVALCIRPADLPCYPPVKSCWMFPAGLETRLAGTAPPSA